MVEDSCRIASRERLSWWQSICRTAVQYEVPRANSYMKCTGITQTLGFKNRSLDFTLSDFGFHKQKLLQTVPMHLLRFLTPKSDRQCKKLLRRSFPDKRAIFFTVCPKVKSLAWPGSAKHFNNFQSIGPLGQCFL